LTKHPIGLEDEKVDQGVDEPVDDVEKERVPQSTSPVEPDEG
jgi:hypothetical protein